MKNRNISVFASNVTTINFCGEPIMWQMDCRIYEPPYETEPTTGEHDFNTCEDCQKNLQLLRGDFAQRFNGTNEKRGFPLCCEAHAEIVKLQVFNRDDFEQVPDWAAKKIIYTRQHIKNHIFVDDYYQEITDYIDYTIDSFGQTPNDSEPLYLGSYLSCISGTISDSKDIPENRKKKLLEYLRSFKAPKKKSQTDFNVLIGTYEKWFKIFPWEMSFFAQLKPQFEKLPIIQSASPINKYSGKVTAKPHTKSSLIEMLLKTTDSILTQINSLVLYEKGLLTDPQKIGIELVCNERRLKIKQGYTNASPDEGQRYRNILKDWFADEKKFIDDITKYLPSPQQNNLPPATSDNKIEGVYNVPVVTDVLPAASHEYKMDEFLNYFSGKCSQKFRDQLIMDMKTILLSNPNGRQITAIASVIYNSDKLTLKLLINGLKYFQSVGM